MNQQTIARLREELKAIEKWEKLYDGPDPIGREARVQRSVEIMRELEKARAKPGVARKEAPEKTS